MRGSQESGGIPDRQHQALSEMRPYQSAEPDSPCLISSARTDMAKTAGRQTYVPHIKSGFVRTSGIVPLSTPHSPLRCVPSLPPSELSTSVMTCVPSAQSRPSSCMTKMASIGVEAKSTSRCLVSVLYSKLWRLRVRREVSSRNTGPHVGARTRTKPSSSSDSSYRSHTLPRHATMSCSRYA